MEHVVFVGFTGVMALVMGLISLLLYFIPTFVAYKRNHPNRFPIFLLNLLLGGTGIGWIVALIWSFTNPKA